MTQLAVIAGQGQLPLNLAENARQQGYDVTIFTISGQANADFSAFDSFEITLGSIGTTRQLVQDSGCSKIVMAGKVQRPTLSQLKPDASAVKLLARAVGRGDDALLRVISAFFDEVGIETISADSFMPEAMMPDGVCCGQINDAIRADIECGVAVLMQLGAHDVGQGVVVQDGRVIAIEAAEGTDAMLRRSADILDKTGPPAVFVKRRKSGQDARLDIPVIGETSLAAVAAAGIGIIALEAGGVLLAGDPQKLWKTATELNLTVVGI